MVALSAPRRFNNLIVTFSWSRGISLRPCPTEVGAANTHKSGWGEVLIMIGDMVSDDRVGFSTITNTTADVRR